MFVQILLNSIDAKTYVKVPIKLICFELTVTTELMRIYYLLGINPIGGLL